MFGKKKNQEAKEREMDTNKETTDEALKETQDQNEVAEAQEEQAPVAEEQSAEEKLKLENTALNDKYLRLYAEFDNYKRRTQKERVELLQTAGKDVIVSLLTVLDDFDRALKATENSEDIKALRDGIVLVHQKFKTALSQKGLKEMESINKDFDTDFHEAITNIPAPSPELKGKVIDEVEKGYTLNDNVIRFAKVVVGA